MDDNTRVLACRIDADLRLRMKEYIAKEGITVKEYVTGLIKENLEKNAVKAKQEEKKTEEKDKTKGEQENKKIESTKQTVDSNKKEIITNKPVNIKQDKGLLKSVINENIKKDMKKQVVKKNQKEEEEEFE